MPVIGVDPVTAIEEEPDKQLDKKPGNSSIIVTGKIQAANY